MTPEQFAQWLADMQAAGRIRAGHGHVQDAADELGITPAGLRRMMARGTTRQTDLACRALLDGRDPYP